MVDTFDYQSASSRIPSDRQSFGQSVRENSGPHIERPDYPCHFHPEVGRFGTSAEGYGETPRAAPIQLSQILHQNDPFLKHIGIGELSKTIETGLIGITKIISHLKNF